MAIRKYKGVVPKLAESAWVDQSAQVIGRCELSEDVGIWPCAVLRGDVNDIKIGARSNIQDGAVVHTTHESARSKGSKTIVGADVTVGHNAVLHGCIIEDECLIGMGAVVLDNAHVKKHVLIGANSLVPAGKLLESGYLYVGSPVKQLRALTDQEKAFFKYSAEHYVKLKNDFAAEDD
ncbi:gamma carbonic anhydrase family protein [Thiomicrospira microaerophila]|uniref:gamma carbonic anhydrase family protein n=1 Tax=Thiomicrospira microaerophila TaxID=406020 RepID=UPI0005C8D62C|nr:gamma carbonic anhydrase family protein [Thiomicrospira microaerophila]